MPSKDEIVRTSFELQEILLPKSYGAQTMTKRPAQNGEYLVSSVAHYSDSEYPQTRGCRFRDLEENTELSPPVKD